MSDTLTWDWREQPDLDELAAILARHGVRLEQVATGRDDYEIRISSDPRQQWTSWADTPEPSTPPAVAAQETPADPGPPAGTPQAADDRTEPILGRALLTRDGHLLTRSPDSRDAWGSGFVRSLVRAHAEDLYGAREVLLVSPAVGEVLEAAQRWRAVLDNGFEGRAIPEAQALVDAVDAMVGDHPAERCPCDEAKEAHWRQFQTEPAPETYRLCNGCGVLLSDPDRDDGCPHCGICGLMVTGSGPRCGRPAGHGGDCAPSPVAADPAESTPEPEKWRCERCGSDRWVGWRAGPEHEGFPRKAQCVPCGHVQEAPREAEPTPEPQPEAEFDAAMAAAEPVQVVGTRPPWRLQAGPPDTHTAARTSRLAPEPDSGPGWDRRVVEGVIQSCRLAGEYVACSHVAALLADRDREHANATEWLRQAVAAAHLEMDRDEARADCVARTRERDRARAEVAQVTADRDRLHRLAGEMTGEVGAANAALVEARQRVKARDEALASCVWVDPGRQSGQPCLGGTRIPVGLIHGLLADGLDGDAIRESYFGVTDEHLIAVRHFDALLASAYREGAADALAYASRLPDRCWTTLRDLAAKVRTGEVTIPASNEEATPDGE